MPRRDVATSYSINAQMIEHDFEGHGVFFLNRYVGCRDVKEKLRTVAIISFVKRIDMLLCISYFRTCRSVNIIIIQNKVDK